MTTADAAERARTRRAIGLLISGLVIEAVCLAVVWLSPALRVFMRPVYVVVAAIFIGLTWHAWRGRSGSDRRQEERRHSADVDTDTDINVR